MTWLTDVLQRIVSHELHTLPPWNWTQPCPPTTTALAA
jgi:hypothetical protein